MILHKDKSRKSGRAFRCSLFLTLFAFATAISEPAHGQQGSFGRNLFFYGFEESEEVPPIEYSGFTEDIDSHDVIDRWYSTINPEEGIGGNRFLQVGTGGEAKPGKCPDMTVTVPALDKGKTYRLTFYVKAPEQAVTTVTVSDNEGMAISETVQASLSGSHWTRCVHVFKTDRNTSFAKVTFAFESPDATYLLDNIQIERSTIAGIYYSGDRLRIDFGLKTDIAEKASQAYSKAISLDPGCLDVSAGGNQVLLSFAELHTDGFLYAWASNDNFDNLVKPVMVSFLNPTESDVSLHYETGETVADFALEEAVPEDPWNRQYIEVLPIMTLPPELICSDPDDGSFNLTPAHDTYVLTFDRPVITEENGVITVKATISDIGGTETLSLASTENGSQVLIFKRTSTRTLEGDCQLTVSGLKSLPKGDISTVSVSMTYGEEKNPKPTVYLSTEFAKESTGTVPRGFHATDGDSDKYNGQSTGGSRLMAFTEDSDIPVGFYLSPRSGSNGGALYSGDDLSGTTLRLTPGAYTVSFLAAGWEGQRTPVQFSIYPKGRESDAVFSTEYSPTNTAYRGQYFTGADLMSYKFGVSKEDEYVLKWFISSDIDNGWGRTTIGDVKLSSSMTRAQSYAYLLEQAVTSAQQVSAATHRKVAEYQNTELAELDSVIEIYAGWSSTSPRAYDEAVSRLNSAVQAVQYRIDIVSTYRNVSTQARRAINSYEGTQWASTILYEAMKDANAQYGSLNLKESPTSTVTDALDHLKPHYDAFDNRLKTADELDATLSRADNWLKSNSYLSELPQYIMLSQLFAEASEIDVYSCTDSELRDAIDGINGTIEQIEKDKSSANVLASQVRELYSLALDIGVDFDGYGIGADAIGRQVNSCLSDDQDLADKLRLALCRRICELYADNSVPSQTDLSDFIGNRHLYTGVKSGHITDYDDPYPDWKFSGSGNIYPGVTWGAVYASDDNPYVDSRIGLDWTAQFTMSQTVKYLPAGIYDLTLGCGTPDARDSYIRVTQKVDGNTIVQEVTITKGGEQSTWNSQIITLGNLRLYGVPIRLEVYVNSGNSWSSIDEFTLSLQAPIEEFDYNRAAQETGKLLPVGSIEADDLTQWENGVVTWTDANGIVSDTPRQGLNLKVTELPDGRRKVEKIIIKR